MLDGHALSPPAYDLAGIPLALAEHFATAPRKLTAKTRVAQLGPVALIPIEGLLSPGPSDPENGIRSYGDIRREMAAAIEADDVRAIVLLVNSPGGLVEGLFDLADGIYRARLLKPSTAIITGQAFSAAYALASSTGSIAVPATGYTGSIGVVTVHTEASQNLARAGIRTTVLRSGPQKMDVNRMEPLSPAALARTQGEVNFLSEMFFELVARNRGLTVEAVRAMEGAPLFGAEGVSAGLADIVLSPDAAFSRVLSASLP